MREGWETFTLDELCEFFDRRGVTPKKLGSQFLSSGYRVISAKNIKERKILTSVGEQRFVDEPTYKKWMKSPLLEDDVLLTSEAPLGEPAYITKDIEWCIGQRLFGLRADKTKLYGRFLFYAFQSPIVRSDLMSRATGATAQGIRQAELRKVKVNLPCVPEQKRIVAILDETFAGIDAAIANTEKKLANARELFESYLDSVLTKKDLGCKNKTLEEVVESDCSLSYGIVQPGKDYDGGLPVVRPTDLTMKEIKIDNLKRINPELARSYSRTTLKGDDLLLCVRGSTGVVSVASEELKGSNVTRGIVPIRFNPLEIDQDFGYYILKSVYVQKQIREKTYGAALMQINIRDLKKIDVPFPELDKQKELVENLNTLNVDTSRLEVIYQQKINSLKELKQSLLQKAFSGELTAEGDKLMDEAVA